MSVPSRLLVFIAAVAITAASFIGPAFAMPAHPAQYRAGDAGAPCPVPRRALRGSLVMTAAAANL